MPRLRKRGSHVRLESALLLFFAIGLLFLFTRTLNKSLDAAGLKIEAGDLRSVVAQAALIAGVAAQGKMTATFFRKQLNMLQDRVDKTLQKLSMAEPKSEIESKLAVAVQLARASRAELSKLGSAFGAREETAMAKRELEDLARQLWSLEQAVAA
jgi:hypothetical protein